MVSLHSSDNKLNDYLYRSISIPSRGKCIRVLDIENGEAFEPSGGPLRTTMRVVDLERRPSFTALSYVWRQQTKASDDRGDTSSILCNDVLVSITTNCYSALLHLRGKLGNFSIWIDAVCINQEDTEEKASQLPLMGDIYSGAKEVYIWLGEGNEATERAMTYLGQAGFYENYLKHIDPNRNLPCVSQVWVAAWSALSGYSTPTMHPFPISSQGLTPAWKKTYFRRSIASGSTIYTTHYDLSELLDREWTKRIWTYQEVILAHNPVVVCGHAHLPWSRFALSIIFLDHVKPRRSGNLCIPIDSTIQTWKKVVLARARLLDEPIPDGEEKREKQWPTSVHYGSEATTKEEEETQPVRSSHIERYRQFLFKTMYTCLMVLRTVATLAYLSLFNLIAAAIMTSVRLSKQSSKSRSITGYAIWTSLAIFAFLIIFPCYVIMTYFYYHKGMFSMPIHSQFKVLLREDATDDFVDAIVTRRATEPRDMAFGLHTVLGRRLNNSIALPDYKASVAHTYKQLTRNLLNATDQLHFLPLAAGNHMDGQPSWVPDWSAELQGFWLQPFATRQAWASSSSTVGWIESIEKYATFKRNPPTKRNYSQQYLSPNQKSSLQKARPERPWYFDPSRENTLTILAHSLGTIKHIFTVEQTETHYDTKERHIHLSNITSILSVFRTFSFSLDVYIDFFTNRQNYPSLPTTITQYHLRLYFIFMWHSFGRTPERMLELLTMGDKGILFPLPYGPNLPMMMTTSYNELFATHIAVCNDLAKTGRQFFRAKAEGRERGRSEEVTGVCKKDAVVGDKLLLVPGLMSSVVTREADVGNGDSGVEINEDKGEIRLVSPAVVFIFVEREMKERGPERLEPFVLL